MKSKTFKVFTIVGILGLSAILYVWLGNNSPGEATVVSTSPSPKEDLKLVDSASSDQTTAKPRDEEVDALAEESTDTVDIENCVANLWTELTTRSESEATLFSSVLTGGLATTAYRDLPYSAVADFAAQGDSAAMITAAQMLAAEAKGLPAWTATRSPFEESVQKAIRDWYESGAADLPPDKELLREAADLAFGAALRGRLQALQLYAVILRDLDSTPVDLGWVSRSEYEKFSFEQKSAISPTTIYNLLIFELAPGLQNTHLFAMVRQSQNPQIGHAKDLQVQLLRRLKSDFFEKLDSASLERSPVFSETFPILAELISKSCPIEE